MGTRDRILRYLQGRDPAHWPSSVREIQAAVDLRAPSNVHRHLEALIAEGLVERGEGLKGFRAVRKEAA